MQSCLEKFSLNNHVIVITGAAGLLGQMHTRAVLDAGGMPVMLDIDESRLKNVLVGLKAEYPGANIEGFVCSITDKDDLTEICEQLNEKYGRIDGLINNACHNPTMKESVKGDGRFEKMTYQEWLDDSEIGIYGSICCSQVFGGYMAKHGGGVILNIASDLGIIAPNQNLYKIEGLPEDEQPKKPVTYSTIKWGLLGLTKYLATYWADKNVRSNALAFGGVYNNQGEPFLSRVKEQIPLGRMANKDEYMGSIVYMLSDASSYMTGAVVSIDGGRTAW